MSIRSTGGKGRVKQLEEIIHRVVLALPAALGDRDGFQDPQTLILMREDFVLREGSGVGRIVEKDLPSCSQVAIGRGRPLMIGPVLDGVAVGVGGLVFWGDEIGAAGGVQDVFVGGGNAFGVVAVEQGNGCFAAQVGGEFPA